MDQRVSRILRIVSMSMLALILYSWLGRLHWLLGAMLFLFAACNAMTAWAVRERAAVMQSVLRIGLGRGYVRFVCHWTGDQVPSTVREAQHNSGLLLHTPRDFDVATERTRQIVRGHDDVVGQMFSRISENVTLRRRQKNGVQQGPLASFLLVGADGIGKRYLSCAVAKLLYGHGAVDSFDCGKVTASELTGQLTEAARKEPQRMFLFEHLDRASVEVSQLFSNLLTSGTLIDSNSTSISFKHSTIVFTTTSNEETLEESHRELAHSAWQQVAIGLLIAESNMSAKLLNGITELLFCRRPDEQVTCEVIALLMTTECRVHHATLIHADAEIIATVALQVDDQRGLSMAPQLVKKLLRKPLIAATVADQKSVSLRVRRTAAFASEER